MKQLLISFLFGGKHQSQLNDIGKLALRFLFGLSLALNHGWPTLKEVMAGASEFPDPLGLDPELSMLLAGTAEFGFALFVTSGLFTRAALIPILINFSVAFFIFHASDPFGNKELAFLYLSSMTAIMLLGPGKYSLDHVLILSEED